MAGSVLQDWKANRSNVKARIVLVLFRLAQKVRRWPKPLLFLGVPHLLFYRIVVEWFMGIELPWNLTVGPRLRVYHGHSLVVHDKVVIGADCILRHCTTIGMGSTNQDPPQVPILGCHVDVGSNVCIIGGIRIGDHVVIGAGSVVVKDVPDFATVVGNPARILRVTVPTETPM